MPRPALSASRSMEIIDFLAAFPGRTFTLSEIARAAKINVASCHAVLNALTTRGYLTRHHKNYGLGPALIAVGHVAQKSQPLLTRAEDAARKLARELQLPVMLTAVAGEEILAVAAIADPSGRMPSLGVGQRMPLVPPIGAPFLAWASEGAIDAWIARAPSAHDPAYVAQWREDLALTRKRGFQLTLRSPEALGFGPVMSEIASSRKAPQYRDRVIELIRSLDERIFHPITIDSKKNYHPSLIAAPIFDRGGAVAFSMCLVEFPAKITGATINTYAEKLIQTCLAVMRHDQAA